MNNVNTQEVNRTVSIDASVAAGRKAATSGSHGKDLPKTDRSQAAARPEPEQPRAENAAQSAQSVERAVAKLNDYVQSFQRDLKFSVDEDLGRAVVTVVDRKSQKVIRQIPNETALMLARNLKDQQQADLPSGDAQGASGLGSSLGLINTRI